MTLTTLLLTVATLAGAGTAYLVWQRRGRRAIPGPLMPGQPLPDFAATTESGERVQSGDLQGAPAVLLFVRGNWCPFCSRQVANLTRHYKTIGDLGARLVLVTPKPLDTTRRVAAFFDVDFEFWLDANLDIARQLGVFLPAGVPAGHRDEYGDDTLRPTALVVDARGVIRYTAVSRFIVDRPNAALLVRELQKL